LITLLPTSPIYRVVHEDRPGDEEAGQYRVELDQSGSADAFFLNIVTGYDAGESALAASLVDNGTSWTLTLSHAVRGQAVVTLMKGMASTGGSIAIDGVPAMSLRPDVQGIAVTSERPVWEAAFLFRDGFESVAP
jgi:hypothetical protein